ncbi:MAG: serine--tRNA ligase [Desulfobacteraceae bacterium]|jgi:seryl-tRNA synthetase|nr:serine--tRNA ligase [Desulfobacteraceae bacterium]
MLEIKYLRQNLSAVQEALQARGHQADLAAFQKWDDDRRKVLQEIESLRHERNVVSDRIAEMKKARENAEAIVVEMRAVSSKIKDLDIKLSESQKAIDDFLMGLPNIPHGTVPIGKDEADNLVVRTVGSLPEFKFEPQAHWDIGSRLKILDLDRAARITGARFPLYFGAGARMERALINFMLDTHTDEHGYLEVLPPFMVNRESMTHTGQLPKFEEDLFKISGWDYFMVPTAEVPVTNIHQGEILDEALLPICYTAYTPCFRSEAGSHGKDTRGLIRQHQFNKVELVKFSRPESSYDELESLLENAEAILKKLGLPYRVIELCTGDLGFSSAKTYDIEVWMPAQGVYREISSCSNFEDFQARRAGIRYKPKGKKGTALVHTLNGSGLAVGRTVAAILENCQQADGSVTVPEKLQPYMGGIEKIAP